MGVLLNVSHDKTSLAGIEYAKQCGVHGRVKFFYVYP